MNTASTTKINKTVVIGGGAAGMLAAFFAAEAGEHVTLVEKNRVLGKKIAITGKGRCNLTNDCDVRTFLENVPTNPKFLYKALTVFSPEDTIAFFNQHGLPTKVERGRRVFPVSDKAEDVSRLLYGICIGNHVEIVHGEAAAVRTADGAVTGVDILGEKGRVTRPADRVILATGGASYPKTGSDGRGYLIASALGHTVVPPKASLVPLCSKDRCCAEMMGLSLKNVTASFSCNGKTVFSELGELLFTHFGVSGPLVLSASAYVRSFPALLSIDLKPALDEKTLDGRVVRDFSESLNKDYENALSGLLPKGMIPVFVRLSGINGQKKVNLITREERKTIVSLLKSFPVHLSGTRPIEEAIITSGGINVREINPSTMESKLVRGLFFAGEIIDVDAYTGGYNLQIAFSTGRLAGLAGGQLS